MVAREGTSIEPGGPHDLRCGPIRVDDWVDISVANTGTTQCVATQCVEST